MTRVPVPSRGQPLDLSYIYQLAEAVNDLSKQVSSTSGRYTSIDTVSAGTQRVKTSDARVVGAYLVVDNNTSTSTSSETPFSRNFDDFAYVPIVTATPILIGDAATESGKEVSVMLTRITTNRVEGIVRFNTIGVASVGINLLAVGIPV
jgi:hypothetical protein